MLEVLTDAQHAALAARLAHAKQYDGLHEVRDQAALHTLIAKAPGGKILDLANAGWCAHFVGAVDAELGYTPYGGRAAEIGTTQVEIKFPIEGCTVACHGHAAFWDDVKDHYFGGNQGNKVCSLHKRFFGEPIGYFIPTAIAEMTQHPAPEQDTPPAPTIPLSDDELLAEVEKRGIASHTLHAISGPVLLGEITRRDLDRHGMDTLLEKARRAAAIPAFSQTDWAAAQATLHVELHAIKDRIQRLIAEVERLDAITSPDTENTA